MPVARFPKSHEINIPTMTDTDLVPLKPRRARGPRGAGLIALACAAVAAVAQEPAVPPAGQCPPGPLLKALPESVDWVITSKFAAKAENRSAGEAVTNAATVSGGSAAPGGEMTPLDMGLDGTSVGRRVGPKRHVVSTFGSGMRVESWSRGDAQVVYVSGRENPEVCGAPPDNIFGSIGWITPQAFQGIRNVEGKDCMFFAAEIEDPSVDREFHAPKVKATALIELERRLPVAMRIGGTTTEYAFTPVPAGQTITFPAEVEEQFKISDKMAEDRAKSLLRP